MKDTYQVDLIGHKALESGRIEKETLVFHPSHLLLIMEQDIQQTYPNDLFPAKPLISILILTGLLVFGWNLVQSSYFFAKHIVYLDQLFPEMMLVMVAVEKKIEQD